MYPVVLVKWWDAASPDNGWLDHADFIQGCSIMEANSTGFLIYEDDRQIKLCQNFFKEDGQKSCGIAIPKQWIVEMVTLSGPDWDKPGTLSEEDKGHQDHVSY